MVKELQRILDHLVEANSPLSSDTISRTLDLKGIEAVRELATPGKPQDVGSALQEALSIFSNRMRTEHSRCFAYITSCPSPLARIGDFLTSIFNATPGLWDLGSGPSVVETTLLRWLASQVGLPPSAGGCFLSSGSMANMTGIVLARDRMLSHAQRPRGVVYVSDQTHSCVAKSLRITGFCDAQIRIIPSQDFRFDVDALRRQIAVDRCNGHLPFLIVASCGTTNTGSIDPLHALADIARDERLWLHVDGAYGASIALSPTYRHLVDGLGRANSIAWDGHKWLFQTYGSGILLARQAKDLENSFSFEAEYIRGPIAPDGTTNLSNFSPDLSRPARAMPLWLTLRVLGQRRIAEMIDHGFANALLAEQELRKDPNWEIVSPATASIVAFRYRVPGLEEPELDALNLAISKRLLAENIAAILATTLRGKKTLRMCALNPDTTPETMVQVVQQMGAVAKSEAARALRAKLKDSPTAPVSQCVEGCVAVSH
ncbi:L-2,4-diaminobutyrate decarboxylase [Aspergillus egyptiacus]|nr:L-2,4-diaminobutyrate decarboxylase [Aspergillus egyptiacus]